MPGKRPHRMIGKLSELLVFRGIGSNSGRFSDAATSPRSPLDCKLQSPRGFKNYKLGGVGLGIVAALEKSSSRDGGSEILAKCAICSTNLNRSVPIPVHFGKNHGRNKGGIGNMDMDSVEDCTYVISHGPDKSFTKVYCDGGEYGKDGHEGFTFDTRSDNFVALPIPEKLAARVVEDVPVYPTSDFLSSCHLCRKNLHGRDIYIYRGEKAFCSAECRSSQIMAAERKEQQCRSEVPRSAGVSSSPYTRSPIFSTGIVVI